MSCRDKQKRYSTSGRGGLSNCSSCKLFPFFLTSNNALRLRYSVLHRHGKETTPANMCIHNYLTFMRFSINPHNLCIDFQCNNRQKRQFFQSKAAGFMLQKMPFSIVKQQISVNKSSDFAQQCEFSCQMLRSPIIVFSGSSEKPDINRLTFCM